MSRPNFEEFAWAILKDWPESDPDMGDIQDLAIKHGLLIGEQRDKPCCENCWCAEYHGTTATNDNPDGGRFDEPITCYRRAGGASPEEATK